MKTKIVLMVIALNAMPLMAQTNEVPNPPKSSTKPREDVSIKRKDHPTPPPEQRQQFKERHLKLMEKALNEIGVNENQRKQILALQKAHREKMKYNWKRLSNARRKLSELQDSGVSMDELDAAIQEVSNAQNAQLKILVLNRMEMERILGKEKNDQLMQQARKFFRKHDRRSGAGMPPRPGFPPDPKKDKDSEASSPAEME